MDTPRRNRSRGLRHQVQAMCRGPAAFRGRLSAVVVAQFGPFRAVLAPLRDCHGKRAAEQREDLCVQISSVFASNPRARARDRILMGWTRGDQSGFIQLFHQLPLMWFIRGYRDVLFLQPIHQHSDAGSRVVETSRRAVDSRLSLPTSIPATGGPSCTPYPYHCAVGLQMRPRPLNLFGVSDWREGCPTPDRDQGNSPPPNDGRRAPALPHKIRGTIATYKRPEGGLSV